MSPLIRLRHRASTDTAGWAVALRALRRFVARLQARRQSGSIEAYLEHTVRECVRFAMSPNEISHQDSSLASPQAPSAQHRPTGQPPTGQRTLRSDQLSTTFNQSPTPELPDS